MSDLYDLLKQAREMCGMSWSDGDDPDDIAGRIDQFLTEGKTEAIQHVAYQAQGNGLGGQLVFYHEKGISIFDLFTSAQGTYALVSHDEASGKAMKDLVRDLHWRSEHG